jgi:2-methylcitrate dehydratase PrpD
MTRRDAAHEAEQPPLLEGVVRHALNTREHGLTDPVAAAARTLLLDAVGVGVAGSCTHETAMARAAAMSWGNSPEASVWGTGEMLSAAHAAFVNAHQMHTLEWDAIHEPAVVHPMTVVTPVLLAWMSRQAARGEVFTGQDLLRGIAVGVDIAGGLGDVTTTPLQFFRPATAGALGAVAAVGAASRLPADRIAAALGIAYGGLSGTMQPHTEGAQVLALQVGFNARTAVNALDLALAGFDGPRFILEGRYGYFRLIEAAGEPEKLVARLGQQWEVQRTSLKPYPSGRATHGALDGLQRLQREHGFTFSDVEAVEIDVPPMVFGLVGRRPSATMSIGASRLCLAYLVPNLLRDGTISLATYEEARVRDPQILAWTERVTISPDGNPDPNAFDPQDVRVHLRDGSRLSVHVPASLGSPSYPMTPEQVEDKFRAAMAAGGRADRADAVAGVVARIDECPDAAELWNLL